MKQLRNVSKVLVALVLVISASSFFVGCKQSNDVKEKPSYTKKDIKFSLHDVVTSAKKADKTFTYNQEFEVYISALDGNGSGYKKFKSNTTEQFFSTRGYFKITWTDDPEGFIVDYFSN